MERDSCYKPMKDALLQHFAHVPLEERFFHLQASFLCLDDLAF